MNENGRLLRQAFLCTSPEYDRSYFNDTLFSLYVKEEGFRGKG